MESKNFIEIKKPVEEVREIENTEQKKLDEKQGSKVIEKLEETILPAVHASDDEEKKEGLKKGTGGAVIGSSAAVGTATTNPGIGAAAGVTTAGAWKGNW